MRQLVQDVTNPPSDHENGHPVLCSGEAPGLRGVSRAGLPQHRRRPVLQGVEHPGLVDVKEAFGELLFPLCRGGGFVSSAAANAAVR